MQQLQYPKQMSALEGNATGRRLVAVPGDVHEHGTAPALHARPLVMIDHDDNIIQVVFAPHSFGAGRVGVLDVPIVVSVADLIAPTVLRPQWPERHASGRAQKTIWSVEGTTDDIGTDGGGAISFALDRAPTGPSQGARKPQPADARPSAGGAHGQRADLKLGGRLAMNLTGQPGPYSGHCFVSLSSDTFFKTS